MRILTWNLYHGRAQPPAGRDLLAEFSAMLAGWDWDVALLQEVPPWWTAPVSKLARVRNDGFSNTRPTTLPFRAFSPSERSRFNSAARSSKRRKVSGEWSIRFKK